MKSLFDEMKEIIDEAFEDMTIIYAPDCVGKPRVKELGNKIEKINKGTLGYIDTKHQLAIKKLDEISAFYNKVFIPEVSKY